MSKRTPLPPPRLVHSTQTVTRYTRALLAAKLNPPTASSAQVPVSYTHLTLPTSDLV